MSEIIIPSMGAVLKNKKAIEQFSQHIGDTTIHVTSSDKTTWSAKYTKPANGVPKTDLATSVQTSLNKSDTAVQTIQINGTEQIKTGTTVNLPAYPTSLPASNTTDTYSSTGTDPVSGKAVAQALGNLDVSIKGGSGKYIQSISETDGKISASEAILDKSSVGLENVENKSSSTIRSEITASNVTTALGYTPINSNLIGANSGLAELDNNGKVPSSQLPSYVDDVIEVDSYSTLPTSGESGKIYITKDTNKQYRWTGTTYAEISASLTLGEISSTAYRGDRGKIAYDHASDSSRLTTAKNSGLYKISTTSEGHVASVTAVVKSDITALGIPGSDTDTTYTFSGGTNKFTVTPSGGTAQDVSITPNINDATTSVHGLMTAADKTKLDGIDLATKVNKPVSDGEVGQVLATNGDGSTFWKTVSGGTGSTDYADLDNKPQINGVELSGNKTSSTLGLASESDLTSHTSNSDIHVTSYNKSDWSAKYYKPSGGIPKSDLDISVQNSINNADTAVQTIQLGGIEQTKTTGVVNLPSYPPQRNLLSNAWFRVNQRQLTTWNSGYGLDRWQISRGKGEQVAGGLKLTTNSGQTDSLILQKIEGKSQLIGKTITASVIIDGTLVTGTITLEDNTTKSFGGPNGNTFYVNTTLADDIFQLNVYNQTTGAVTFKAVKLEEGSVSTLSNDTPLDYGEDLAQCQRYFYRLKGNGYNVAYIGVGNASSASNFTVIVRLPVCMRTTPVISVSAASDLTIYRNSTFSVDGSAAQKNNALPPFDNFGLLITASGMTAGDSYFALLKANGHIDASADL